MDESHLISKCQNSVSKTFCSHTVQPHAYYSLSDLFSGQVFLTLEILDILTLFKI